jgi:hypothetical protein
MYKKYGQWKAGDTVFNRKFDAMLHASKNNLKVKFVYHDQIWEKFDKTLLGKVPLSMLYKERAQQLRDSYQYLILNYSGGADSHNILMTFLNNNIKLDEICVKWPKVLMDGNLYSPNNVDRSALNYWSEWDYSVKPTLDWVSRVHPNIKITIKDFVGKVESIDIESLFDKIEHIRSGAMLQTASISDSDLVLADKSITTGHIYGIDKPLLALGDNNRVGMFFSDLAISPVVPGVLDPENAECFYWAPDMPLLTFEMAYQASEYYNINKDKRNYLWKSNNTASNGMINQFQNDVTKAVCYDTWDNRFQADKPTKANRTDKWFWFFENSEFETVKNIYIDNVKLRTDMITDEFKIASSDGISGFKTMSSSVFYFRTLDE